MTSVVMSDRLLHDVALAFEAAADYMCERLLHPAQQSGGYTNQEIEEALRSYESNGCHVRLMTEAWERFCAPPANDAPIGGVA